ncbi:hypothetical protein [Variovorax paradoxus]|uniref:hypothetical protein n=1 Tax=Variovorax paradoxus TaxID=34073 RepID=UPI003D662227
MSKLLRFKEWLTLEEAARHLAIMFGEQVTEADVLRLGLDGHLRLSVNFVNHTKGRRGRVAKYTRAALNAAMESDNLPTDLEWITWPAELTKSQSFPEAVRGKPITSLVSLNLDDERYLTLGDHIGSLEGVWDLAMVGGERLDLEHSFQRLTGGPAVTLQTLDGAFVQREEDEIWQLQESFDDNEFQKGSTAQLERLKRHIAQNGIARAEAESLLAKHKEDRKKFVADRMLQPALERYYPAGGLPHDAVVVVRTSALLDFQQRSNDRRDEKPLGERERNTLLRIIGVLSKEAGLDLTKPSKAGAAMESWAASMGVDLAKRTAEEHLKRVAASMEGGKS